MIESFVSLLPFLLYISVGIIAVGSMIGISSVLGERNSAQRTKFIYESGILPTGSSRQRMSVSFFITAVLFLVFDVQSIFIFAWSVSLRLSGWYGFYSMLFFILILLIALVYLVRNGALDMDALQKIREKIKGAHHATVD